PLLRQCYDSALGARSLAASLKSGEIGALRLALSHGIDIDMLLPQVTALSRHFRGLELKFMRGTAVEVAEFLKHGDVELAIAAPIGEAWDRLDSWPLFTESFAIIVNREHPLAGRSNVSVEDLGKERLLVRTYCEQAGEFAEFMRSRDIDITRGHDVTSERDLIALIEANVGVAVVPNSMCVPAGVARAPIGGLELRRTVSLYGVAGRERTAVAAAAMKLLR